MRDSESPDNRESRPDNRQDSLPDWAEWLISTLAGARFGSIVAGDFAEVFSYVATREGRLAAFRWYWAQVFRSLPAFLFHGTTSNGIMIKSYLVTAFRSVRKRLFFSAINIGGLALGMAACLLIFQYVAFELSYDSFHERADELYRVVFGERGADGAVEQDAYTWYGLAPALTDQVPEVAAVARYHPTFITSIAPLENGNRLTSYREEQVVFADPSLLQMFSFPLVSGSAETVLSEPHTLILSESTARRYFGAENPVGRTLDVRGWTDAVYTVTGVFRDVPDNSHFEFDFLLPIRDILEDEHGQYAETNGWGWTNFVTYVQLRDDTRPEEVLEKVNKIVLDRRAEQYAADNATPALSLQPVRDIHLYTSFVDADFSGTGYRTVYFFTIVALFILIIAWVNYVNLATARASERSREIGVRKASGALRGQVVNQFLVEAAVLNGLALLLALGLVWLGMPILNTLAGVTIDASVWKNPILWGGLVAVFGVGTLLVSLYPAIVLSAFMPAVVLKGGGASARGRDLMRRGLVVVQFAASLALLVGTYVVYDQVEFMRNQEVGVDIDEVLVVRRPGFIDDSDEYESARSTFIDELSGYAGIGAVSTSTTVPGAGFSLGTRGRRSGDAEEDAKPINMTWVSDQFAESYGLRFIAGRDIDSALQSDIDNAVIVNETTVQNFGWESPEDAVGQTVVLGRSSEREVVGVFEDFHWTSVKQPYESLLLGATEGGAYYSIRMQTNDVEATLHTIRETYERIFPGNAFDYFYADRNFARQYAADQRFGTLFGLFAALALVIACLGLVGLAAYTVARRTKEIGVRKVLGASGFGVARLLLTDVVKLVVIATVISAPVLYFAVDRWLESFATRVAVGPATFLIPAFIVLCISILTVAYHTIRIAHTDPVRALRYE